MRYFSVSVTLCLAGLMLQLVAQTANSPSLKDQLNAQYSPDAVLVVQKDGILGVAPIIIKTCPARYQAGSLKAPDPSCYASIKDSSRMLPPGERVNPKEIKVNVQQETISLLLVECDACNKGITSTSYKAQVDFQFARGYLEKGNVSAIEDTIGQILTIGGNEEAQGQGGQANANLLTNDDIMKMSSAKLGEGIILNTIKTEPCCNFDTSVNGMIKLKSAGVSDGVIQAMRDAQASGNAAPNDQGGSQGDQGQNSVSDAQTQASAQTQPMPATISLPGQLTISVRHRHRTFFNPGTSEVETYCYGALSISPDGTVTYTCDRTDDPSGRCDNVTLAAGSLKQAKVGYNGALHLESKKQGKWDFFGNQNELKQALDKITPTVQK